MKNKNSIYLPNMHNFEKQAPLLDRISYVKYLQNYRKTRNAYLTSNFDLPTI